MDLTVDLPDPAGGKVISIEIARKSRFDRKCPHYRIAVDVDFAAIECRDCGKELNPIEWIAMMTEEWARVTSLYKKYTVAKELYDEKERSRCQHCGKMTRINPPSDFDKRMRERGHMTYG